MSDGRMVLAQFPTTGEAKQAATAFAKAFKAHLAAVKKTKNYRGQLTAALEAFAKAEGFDWPDEDTFRFDDSDDDPGLSIGSAGHLLVIVHAAAGSLAYGPLQAFAKRRGATASTYWNPDPTPGTLTVSGKTAAFHDTFDEVFGERDMELEIVDKRPDARSVLAIKGGKKTRYAALHSYWGVGELLLELGKRAGVDVTLEVVEQAPVANDPVLDPQLRSIAVPAVWAMRRAKADEALVRDVLAAVEQVTGGRVTAAEIEAAIPIAIENNYEVNGIPAGTPSKAVTQAIAAQPALLHKLAAAHPVTQREVAMAATGHKRFADAAKGPHRWRHIQLGPLLVAVHEGPFPSRARFARRDARKLVFKERVLAGASFDGALLDEADFTKADVSGACFANASATRARFDGAKLGGADFTRANLTGASFKGADLRGAIFAEAVVEGADFTDAQRA